MNHSVVHSSPSSPSTQSMPPRGRLLGMKAKRTLSNTVGQVILTLQSENGTAAPRAEGAAVRLYREGAESLKAAFLAGDGESPVSAEAVRREDGWWEIPWQGNGIYSVE